MNRPEQRLQTAVAAYLSWALAPPTTWTSHPLGGGGLERGRAIKNAGARAGWPDIEILCQGRFYGIELKTKSVPVSDVQRECHALIEAAGCPVAVCRSLDDVQAALDSWSIPCRITKPSSQRIVQALARDLS